MATNLAESTVSPDIALQSATRGRYRFRVGALYRAPDLKQYLERRFSVGSPEMRAAANVLTRSLLIVTQEEQDAERLASDLEHALRKFAEEQGVPLAALVPRERGRAPGLPMPRSLRARLARPKSDARPETACAITPDQPWHTLAAEDVIAFLETDAEHGLDGEEAARRLARHGANVLRQASRRSTGLIFLGQLKQWPVALLGGSAVLAIATGGFADAIAIALVLAANAAIGTITETSAERTIASLAREAPSSAFVLRGGALETVDADQLVPGDVIELRPGTRLGFDGRLISADQLSIDESALTGESLPSFKEPSTVEDPHLPLAERHNMVYRGTTVTGGSARAVVTATGTATEIGEVQRLVGEVGQPQTPMQRQLERLGHRTLGLALASCSGVVMLGLLRGQPLLLTLKTAVSLAVAAVPEGLPTVAITTLTIGIRRMRRKHVIVRRLDAVETLGAVQVLCFDKTGTITENRMRAAQIMAGKNLLRSNGEEPLPRSAEGDTRNAPELRQLLTVAALCSEAELEEDGTILGSATESALVQAALDFELDVAKLRGEHRVKNTEHRAQGKNWMSTLHERSGQSGLLLAVKGSVEEVLDRCRYHLVQGETLELTQEDRAHIRRSNQRMADKSLRVLGFANAELDSPRSAGEVELTWLGLVGLADPPRAGTAEVLRRLHEAGIRTVMITGDQSSTARAIARTIGIAPESSLETVDSTELESLNPEVLSSMARRAHVFSRVNPTHKLQIVKAMQAAGLVVAMTGDGVNDGPALKAADVGVAMGAGGSEVAHEVADIILEHDDLSTMLEAIEQGRVIYEDIQKAVHFILSTNLSEILLTLATVAIGRGQGLSPMQLLWVNLITDIFPELALGLLPAERDVLRRAPRASRAPMFERGDLTQIGMEGATIAAGALSAYVFGLRRGPGLQASTLGFVTLTSAQLLHAFSTSSKRHAVFSRRDLPREPYVPLSVAGGIGLTLLAQVVPGLRRALQSAPMAVADWPMVVGSSVATFAVNEALKMARARRAESTNHE